MENLDQYKCPQCKADDSALVWRGPSDYVDCYVCDWQGHEDELDTITLGPAYLETNCS